MKRNLFILGIVIAFSLSISTNVFAEAFEGNTESNATVIVDEANNSIEYIYTQSADEVVKGVFEDIPDNAWYNEFVSILKQINVIDGVSETEFDPNREITRGEFVKLIAAIENIDLSSYNQISTFSDVSTDDWYSEYVSWAAENGIAEGIDENYFLPQNSISREEAIVMLYRYAMSYGDGIIYAKHYNAQYEKPVFLDENEISSWAIEGIDFLSIAGVICGDNENMLRPKRNITRAEAAKMIAVYYLFDKRPTLITDGIAISYSGTLDYEQDAVPTTNIDIVEDDINFYDGMTMAEGELETMNGTEDLALGVADNDGITPQWCGDQHRSIVTQAIYILSQDNNNSKTPKRITKLNGRSSDYKYSTTALDYVREGSIAPDYDETIYSVAKHYYHFGVDIYGNANNSAGYSKDESRIKDPRGYNRYSVNARWGFNDHYYNARMEFNAGNYAVAYRELGRSVHYLQDTNAPHHAALIDNDMSNNGHYNYEHWVKNNFYNSYWETSASGSYDFMINSNFLTISNNFSKLAYDSYGQCINYESNSYVAESATGKILKRTQRAVTGLFYRFLRDTGREF